MSQRLSIQLFIALVAIAAFLSGCQQGKRKDSEVLVYSEGIARAEKIEIELHTQSIDLTGFSVQNKKLEPTLPQNLKTRSKDTQSAQVLLEEYIIVTRQLLKLGDTRAVVFPEKNRIQASHLRASKYLGQIYAEMEWGQDENPVQTFAVDNEEFNVRFARGSAALRGINDAGLTIEVVQNFVSKEQALSKLDPSALRKLKTSIAKLIDDLLRQRILLLRNSYFNIDGMKGWGDNITPIAGFYYHLGVAINEEHVKKTGKPIPQ